MTTLRQPDAKEREISSTMSPKTSFSVEAEAESQKIPRPLPLSLAPVPPQGAPGLSSLSALQRKRKEISPVRGSDGGNVTFLPKRQRHPNDSTPTDDQKVEEAWNRYAEQVTPENASLPAIASLAPRSFDSELQPGQFEDHTIDSGCVGTVSEDELIDSITTILENICSINNDRIAIPLPIAGRVRAPYRSATYPDGSSSIFFSLQRPAISMRSYVHRLVKYLHVSSSVFVVALIYLDRVHAADEILALTDLNVHRLITTALVVACKFLEDEVHRNSTVCRIGGVPTTAEMNLLESQFLRRINWDCSVSVEVYNMYKNNVFKKQVVGPNEGSPMSSHDCPSPCSESPSESGDGTS